jgi:hypothetical protein
MQRDAEKQEATTFGAIIERPQQHSPEPPPPRLNRLSASKDKTATTVLPAAARASPELSTPTSIRPHLHLAAAAQIIDPPLPSPYSISEAHDAAHNVDLEAAIPSAIQMPAVAVLSPDGTPTTIVTASAPVNSGAQRVSVPDTIAAASTVVAGGGGGLHTPQRLGSTRSTASTSSQTSSTARTAVAVAEKTAVVTTGDSLRPAGTGQECTMWPSASELRDRHKREKRARSRNPLRKLSRRNRVIISVVIALTVISAAVGIGVGISRAYHGEVWAGNGKSMPIPVRFLISFRFEKGAG